MKTGLLVAIAVAVVLVATIVTYNQWHTERPLEERFDDSMSELQQGNLGNAANEMGAATYGEKITNEAEQAYDSAKQSTQDAYNAAKEETNEAINSMQQAISPTTN